MSRLVARILLSIFMFPLAGVFYTVAFVAFEENGGTYSRSREFNAFVFCGFTTWIFVAIYWCVLWRGAVMWNTPRVVGTIGSAFGAAIAGAFVGVLASAAIRSSGSDGFGAFVGSVSTILLWLIATVLFWRETARERASRTKGSEFAVTCPTCGYNLTGLSESRCPECGSKFTIDQLVALQPSAKMEIE